MARGNIVHDCFVDIHQGSRDYMEDFVCINEQLSHSKLSNDFVKRSYNEFADYFAVFDGHGGSEAAKFAQHYLIDEITKQTGFFSRDPSIVSNAITDGFVSTSKAMWNVLETWPRTRSGRPSTAGTTASIAVVRDRTLYVANVGDSSVVLGVHADNGHCIAKMLTVEHKPNIEQEKQRIETDGGIVMEKGGIQRVVWKRPVICRKGPVSRGMPVENIPFLAISRALGDLWSYNAEKDAYVVSPKPDVTVLDIDKNYCFMILASDGLWNVVEPTQAVDVVANVVSKMMRSETSQISPATALVQLALQTWAKSNVRADNISVVVVLFDNSRRLGGSPVKNLCCLDEYQLGRRVDVITSFSDTPIRCPVNLGPATKQLYIAHGKKKSDAENPLKMLNGTQHRKCKSVKRQRNKFKIPATPEQRRAFWTDRKNFKMLETLPLGFHSPCR